MKISVAIPAYNSAKYICYTIDAVLQQSYQPFEILVLDDGSVDETSDILKSYGPTVKILTNRRNMGTARARNVLCREASGEVVAFLDHDDIWHRDYLLCHVGLYREFPNSVATFVGHETFWGEGPFIWPKNDQGFMTQLPVDPELINPSDFIRRYHTGVGPFMSMSFCSIPKRVLDIVGTDPFPVDFTGVDDFFLFNRLPLIGPIAYHPKRLAAYRITPHAQSVNRLRAAGLAVRSMEALKPLYRKCVDRKVRRIFAWASGVQHREYARILMGAGYAEKARVEFIKAVLDDPTPISLVKSIGLLASTWMPVRLQPKWLSPIQTPRLDQRK